MRIKTTLIAAAVAALPGAAAFAGGFDDEVVQAPVEPVIVEPEETGSSAGSLGSLGGGAASILPVVGAVALVAALAAESDSDSDS